MLRQAQDAPGPPEPPANEELLNFISEMQEANNYASTLPDEQAEAFAAAVSSLESLVEQ